MVQLSGGGIPLRVVWWGGRRRRCGGMHGPGRVELRPRCGLSQLQTAILHAHLQVTAVAVVLRTHCSHVSVFAEAGFDAPWLCDWSGGFATGGCLDPSAENYDPDAQIDEPWTCTYGGHGGHGGRGGHGGHGGRRLQEAGCGDCGVCLELANGRCHTGGGHNSVSECENHHGSSGRYEWCGDSGGGDSADSGTGDGTSVTCEFEPGDGTGGSESRVDDAATPEACVSQVQAEQPEANGATYSSSNGRCYAEFTMTGVDSSYANFQTCLMTASDSGTDESDTSTGFYELRCGGTSCSETEYCADSAEEHEVGCCADTEVENFVQVSGCSVWSERDFGNSDSDDCQHALNFDAATEFCEAHGGRLCTADELESGCTRGTGCSHDSDMLWSSTEGVPWDEGKTQSHAIQSALVSDSVTVAADGPPECVAAQFAACPVQCTGCYSGTSGVCQQANTVCHDLSQPGTIHEACPAGTTLCAQPCARHMALMCGGELDRSSCSDEEQAVLEEVVAAMECGGGGGEQRSAVLCAVSSPHQQHTTMLSGQLLSLTA